MKRTWILSAALLLPSAAIAQPRVSPGFLAGVNILGSASTPSTGQVWVVNANTMAAYQTTPPPLFASVGVNALLVTSSTGTAFSGYLATTAYGTSAGDIYQFTITGLTFTTLVQLNTTAFTGGNIAQMVVYGTRIYVVHQNAAATGAVISSVPTAGGPAKVEFDLTAQPGFLGLGNAMARYGGYLYVATWNPGQVEQLWKWDLATFQAALVNTLPPSLSTGGYFGPVNMQVLGNSLILAGVNGDVAWLKADGAVDTHLHSGPWDAAQGKYTPNMINSICRFDPTSDWVLGSRDGALDVLVRSHGADKVCLLGGNTAASVTGIVSLPEASGYNSCFGDGGMGSGGYFPVQVHHGTPHLNMTWQVGLYGGPGGAPAFLALGLSSKQWGALKLPFSLAPLGAPSQTLWISQDLVLPALLGGTGAGQGSSVAKLGIPNSPSLVGGSFHTQWVLLDTGANTLGITAANAYGTAVYP